MRRTIFRNLFQYIQHYQAENLELDAKLKPFIQDYIPAVGDTDPFIKVSILQLIHGFGYWHPCPKIKLYYEGNHPWLFLCH